jgi:hypothetical protein
MGGEPPVQRLGQHRDLGPHPAFREFRLSPLGPVAWLLVMACRRVGSSAARSPAVGHEIEEVGGDDPGSADEDRAVEDLLAARGWVITGRWTNDEWEQWVAPVRRRDT